MTLQLMSLISGRYNMALLLMEGFDWLDDAMTAAQLATVSSRKWGNNHDFTNGTDATTEVGIGFNGRCLVLRERAQFLRIQFGGDTPAASAEVGFAFWCNRKDNETATSFDTFFGFRDTNGSVYQLNLKVQSNGFLSLYKNTTLIVTTTFNVSSHNNEWHYYEVKGVIDDTNGSYEVRVDGVTVAIDTGPVDTEEPGNGQVDAIQFEGISNYLSATDPHRTLFDNIIVWDNSGSGLTDFPSNPALVRAIFPDGDGDDEQWATSSGTSSFVLINETAPHDDDSDYIQDTVSANRSLFTYDTVGSHTTYLGVQINSFVRETDASDFSLINSFKQGGTVYNESSQAIAGQTYENLLNIRETDPDTSSAWTESGLNSLQAGVEVA